MDKGVASKLTARPTAAAEDSAATPTAGMRTFFANAERDRRISAARTVLVLACIGPIVVFAYSVMEMLLGHPDAFRAPDVFSREALIDAVWLLSYGVAAVLVARRHALGGALGLALFGRTIVLAFLYHRLLTLDVGYAVLGEVLIARAMRSLRWTR